MKINHTYNTIDFGNRIIFARQRDKTDSMKENEIILDKIVEGIQEKKGRKIVTADLRHIDSSSAQYFIICEGNSPLQVSAIADNVREYVQESTGVKPVGYDGYQNAQWIVLDYGNIYVHIFLPEYRKYYNLEQLWSDAKLSVIPDVE